MSLPSCFSPSLYPHPLPITPLYHSLNTAAAASHSSPAARTVKSSRIVWCLYDAFVLQRYSDSYGRKPRVAPDWRERSEDREFGQGADVRGMKSYLFPGDFWSGVYGRAGAVANAENGDNVRKSYLCISIQSLILSG
jgi:hypothetical protein